MKLRKDAKYDLLIPTSMGVRITPEENVPTHVARSYRMQSTSAESNVGSTSAALGKHVKILTRFVEDSPISYFIKSDLRRRNIEYEGLDVPQGGPWGYRHQFNIADSGSGIRAPRVWNDRAGEVGRTISLDDFDLDRLLVDEGAKIIHLSGLFVSMSPETAKFCEAFAKKAKENGAKICFDLNYRASFWKNREKELSRVFHEVADIADVLVGNEEDFQLALGMEGPETGGVGIQKKIDGFKGMIEATRKQFPNVEMYGTTLREVVSANQHLWGAILCDKGEWHTVDQRPIGVIDRIGGGDGFVGGLIYGLLNGWDSEKCLQFAWATGALATTVSEDYYTPYGEEEIWRAWSGNARVVR